MKSWFARISLLGALLLLSMSACGIPFIQLSGTNTPKPSKTPRMESRTPSPKKTQTPWETVSSNGYSSKSPTPPSMPAEYATPNGQYPTAPPTVVSGYSPYVTTIPWDYTQPGGPYPYYQSPYYNPWQPYPTATSWYYPYPWWQPSPTPWWIPTSWINNPTAPPTLTPGGVYPVITPSSSFPTFFPTVNPSFISPLSQSPSNSSTPSPGYSFQQTQFPSPQALTSPDVKMREGETFRAAYYAKQPTWAAMSPEYPCDSLISGGRDTAQDLQASFRLGWNETSLFVAVKVHDELFTQNASGVDIDKHDGVEILLDRSLSGDFSNDSLNEDDYQLGISPGNPSTSAGDERAPQAFLWYPLTDKGTKPGVVITSKVETGIWRTEAAIPWETFGNAPMARGQILGFALSVFDNDNPGASEQQAVISCVASRKHTNPTTWGNLILE